MTRSEHMEWCKERALVYLEKDDPRGAITSMLSDLSKHEETAQVGKDMGMIAMFELANGTQHSIRRFIEGFN